jgi:hypothetical protein
MSTKFRPTEIQAWIKSKKKTIAPTINPDKYGTQFMTWWKGMQPEWRSYMDLDTNGSLNRDTPAEEDWLALKKGGTAGMHIVVMGLSWWVNTQTSASKNSNDAWSAVADLLWVFCHINQIDSPAAGSRKRAHDDDKDESQPKKKYVIPLCYYYYHC